MWCILLLLSLGILFIFRIVTPCQIHDLKIFSPIRWVVLLLCGECLLMHKTFNFHEVRFATFLLPVPWCQLQKATAKFKAMQLASCVFF